MMKGGGWLIKHSILLKDRLSLADSKVFPLKPAPSAALSIDLRFLKIKCAIPIMCQSNDPY